MWQPNHALFISIVLGACGLDSTQSGDGDDSGDDEIIRIDLAASRSSGVATLGVFFNAGTIASVLDDFIGTDRPQGTETDNGRLRMSRSDFEITSRSHIHL